MKAQDCRIKLLQDTAFFGGIKGEIVSLILELSPTIEVDKGQNFCVEGDKAKAMYIIEKGEVSVLKKRKGKSHLLRKLKAGDCFGEMALMDFKPRSASVKALCPCKAIEITPATLREVFATDLEQFTIIQMNMGREVCRRLRVTDHLIFERNLGAEITDKKVEFFSI